MKKQVIVKCLDGMVERIITTDPKVEVYLVDEEAESEQLSLCGCIYEIWKDNEISDFLDGVDFAGL